jgi:2-dehydropantoate 2-reductase
VMNCAANAVSALARVTYGEIAANAEARKLVTNVVREVLAVAGAAGILVPGMEEPERGIAAALKLAEAMSKATSSTAQDLAKGKRTEIDALNGYIARRGDELGVAAPVNHALYTLVKLAEGRA